MTEKYWGSTVILGIATVLFLLSGGFTLFGYSSGWFRDHNPWAFYMGILIVSFVLVPVAQLVSFAHISPELLQKRTIRFGRLFFFAFLIFESLFFLAGDFLVCMPFWFANFLNGVFLIFVPAATIYSLAAAGIVQRTATNFAAYSVLIFDATIGICFYVLMQISAAC